MVGYPLKPFPKAWGAPRGWPKNFRPYYASLQCSANSAKVRVEPAALEHASVVIVRHAHSAAQASRAAEKKMKRKLLEVSSPLRKRSAPPCSPDAFKLDDP